MSERLCPYCHRQMEMDPKSRCRRTKDHVIPQANGGKVVVWACWECNHDKGSKLLPEWHAQLAAAGDDRARHVAWFISEHYAAIQKLQEEFTGLPAAVQQLIAEAVARLVFHLDDNAVVTKNQRARAYRFAREIERILSEAGYLTNPVTR